MAAPDLFLPMASSMCVFTLPGVPNTRTLSVRSRKLPSSNERICRAAFAGNHFVSKAASDFSSGNWDWRSILAIRFSCRSSHSRCTSS